MTQKTKENPWIMDVRVRERNLKSGALTDKDLEKQLAALPDLNDQAESFATAQPALAQPAQAPAIATAAASETVDEVDDEEDDDIEEEEDEPEVPNTDLNGEGTP